MAKWFLDTEFHEDGRTIDLISIGLVSERGDEYFAVSTEFDPAHCNDWVRANVLPKLPPRGTSAWKSRERIAQDIRRLCLADGEPEFWSYFADYDWVVLCQLFGTMMNLPAGFPMFCMDLKQTMRDREIAKSALPEQDQSTEHGALADARWVRDAWLHIQKFHPRHDRDNKAVGE